MGLPLLNFGHTRWREQLSPYLDGRLDERERAVLDRHLAGCAQCRVELEQLRQTVALLRAVPAVSAPRTFVLRPGDVAAPAGRGASVRLLDPGASGEHPVWAGMRWATAAAALLLVGVVTYDVGVNTVAPEWSATQGAASLAAPAAPAAPSVTRELQQKSADAPERPAAAPRSLERGAVPASGEGAAQDTASQAAGAPPPSGAASERQPSGAPGGGPSEAFSAETSPAYQDEATRPRGTSSPVPSIAPLRLLEVILGVVVAAGVAVLLWSRRPVP